MPIDRDDLRVAYGAAATAWAGGAAVVYDALAEVMVARLGDLGPGPVLDLCAGSGAVSAALTRRGVAAIAVDLSESMIRVNAAARPPGVVADAMALPLRTGVCSGVVTAFGLNHASDPVAFLCEAARVCAPGGLVAASTFEGGWPHPAKAAVDRVVAAYGHAPPGWHDVLKHEVEPRTATVGAMLECAVDAGFRDPQVSRHSVALDATVEQVVRWRLSMASHASFVDSLPPAVRRALVAAASVAVSESWEPLVVPMLVMSASV